MLSRFKPGTVLLIEAPLAVQPGITSSASKLQSLVIADVDRLRWLKHFKRVRRRQKPETEEEGANFCFFAPHLSEWQIGVGGWMELPSVMCGGALKCSYHRRRR